MVWPLSAIEDSLRQRAALGSLSGRPWAPPERRWFMAQTWRDLLFAHWRVEPDALRRVVPSQLPLDTRDGAAWIGVTPFQVQGLRLRNSLPLPGFSSFFEVNVRTYVRVGARPGIYFLSLDATSRAAVLTARRTYRLPYFRIAGGLNRRASSFHVTAQRQSADGPPAELDVTYEPEGDELPIESDSLERWLTERYCLYTLDDSQSVQCGEIHHPPWPLQRASARFDVNSMAGGVGLELQGEPLLHFASRQDVVLWTLEGVSGAERG